MYSRKSRTSDCKNPKNALCHFALARPRCLASIAPCLVTKAIGFLSLKSIAHTHEPLKGQAGIEALLIMATMLSFISLSLGLCSELEQSSRYALDLQAANSFSSGLKSSASRLLFLGEGSHIEVSSKVLCEWSLVTGSEGIGGSIEVSCGKDKRLVALPELFFPYGGTFSKEIRLFLVKSGGKIIALQPKP